MVYTLCNSTLQNKWVNNMSFGKYIQDARNKRRVSVKELADLVKIDFTYIHKIEGGHVPPPGDAIIYRLALALDLDEKYLLCLAGRVPPALSQMLAGNPALAELIDLLSQQRLPDECYREIREIILQVQGYLGG